MQPPILDKISNETAHANYTVIQLQSQPNASKMLLTLMTLNMTDADKGITIRKGNHKIHVMFISNSLDQAIKDAIRN